ncbi:hypothetical protein NLU13_7791 [Sarocladium strictum]|uniref:F-box domain-containing protein n=1 Tax=Sarocladium strictum TaxID=5046 RepID=A0AA39GDF7_SARSR|nr:hypothetical protein NLU13_7791 [Sarocladium strictum]
MSQIHCPSRNLRSRYKKGRRRQEPVPKILDLPPELLYEIGSHLNIYQRFRFSQTCRTTRVFFGEDWEEFIPSRPLSSRLEFYSGVAATMADAYCCAACGALHPVDEHDTPATSRYKVRACQHALQRKLGQTYNIREAHVQIALKLCQPRYRAGHRDFLRQLMEPYRRKGRSLVRWSTAVFFEAVPRIVRGRFLLRTTHEWVTASWESMAPLDVVGHHVCPHQELVSWHPGRQSARTEFEQRVLGLFEGGSCGQALRGFCRQCRTDVEFVVNPGHARVTAWHDFGGPKTPDSWEWRDHVRGETMDDERLARPDFKTSWRVKERFEGGW